MQSFFKIFSGMANSVDPDLTTASDLVSVVAWYLGLHCLHVLSCQGL